jgi:hypothetical protein
MTLAQIGCIFLLAAEFVGLAAYYSLESYPNQFEHFLVIPLLIGLASLLISFIGICLCWNAPNHLGLASALRAFVVLVILTGTCLVACYLCFKYGDEWSWIKNGPSFKTYVILLSVAGGSGLFIAVILWSVFLQGIADEFGKRTLSAWIHKVTCACLFAAFLALLVFQAVNYFLVAFFAVSGLVIQLVLLQRIRQAMNDGLKNLNRATIGEPRA